MKVATKLPAWKLEAHDDSERLFSEQLERLQLDSVDFYLLHGLGAGSLAKLREHGVLELGREGAGGRAASATWGSRSTTSSPVFEEMVDATDLWEFCQIQYNYMDEEYQAGTRGLEYAAAKGLGVIVMEPLRGGQPGAAAAGRRSPRSGQPPTRGAKPPASAPRTPVDWALQWVWSHAEVSFLLSGMSTMEQLEENLACAERSAAGGARRGRARDLSRACATRTSAVSPIPCTNCRYCLPCPSGVDDPQDPRHLQRGR